MRYLIFLSFLLMFLGCEEKKKKKVAKWSAPQGESMLYLETDVNTDDFPIEKTGSNVVKMETNSGVKYIWVEINGVRMKFIFDTGASDIFISPVEAQFMVKQGTLTKDDILGIQWNQDASGNISKGTVINLREVKIGDKMLYNVKASVSNNDGTPLLLGQSVLERFGKIEIDNSRQEIILY